MQDPSAAPLEYSTLAKHVAGVRVASDMAVWPAAASHGGVSSRSAWGTSRYCLEDPSSSVSHPALYATLASRPSVEPRRVPTLNPDGELS